MDGWVGGWIVCFVRFVFVFERFLDGFGCEVVARCGCLVSWERGCVLYY